MLIAFVLNEAMPRVVMLNDDVLSIVILSVVILNVVSPYLFLSYLFVAENKEFIFAICF